MNSRLFISARSPFARRVRIVLRESKIPHTEQVVDLFGGLTPEFKELVSLNPLGRVPVLKLSSSLVLVESSHIVERIFESHPSETLFPQNRRMETSYWSGLALGVNEATVRTYLESLRSPSFQDPGVKTEFDETIEPTLELAERLLPVSQTPSLHEVDWAIAMDYFSLRISETWMEKYPRLFQNLNALKNLKSFAETGPPRV